MPNVYNVIANALASVSGGKLSKASSNSELSTALKAASTMPDYDAILPKELGVSPKRYTEKSQEELLKEAKNLVNESYSDKIKSVEEKYKNKINTLEEKENIKSQSFASKTEKATDRLSTDTENANFKLIKNGMANSSIIGGYLENLNKSYIEDINKIANDYAVFSANIEKEISLATDAKMQALASYDIKSAADIEKKVIALKSEQSRALEEINKYNKQLFEDNKTFETDRENTLEQLKKAWELKQK